MKTERTDEMFVYFNDYYDSIERIERANADAYESTYASFDYWK